jgi:hypothetical protein
LQPSAGTTPAETAKGDLFKHLADAMKLPDALAIAHEDAGRELIMRIGTDEGMRKLSQNLSCRPYLLPIIVELSNHTT